MALTMGYRSKGCQECSQKFFYSRYYQLHTMAIKILNIEGCNFLVSTSSELIVECSLKYPLELAYCVELLTVTLCIQKYGFYFRIVAVKSFFLINVCCSCVIF